MEQNGKKGFLFNVDVLIEGYSNGIALENLIHLLNSDKIKDYKVKQGIEIGKIIDATLKEMPQKAVSKETPLKENKGKEPSKKLEAKPEDKHIINLIDKFKENNTLIRLSVLKGKGVKLSMPCRILNYDHDIHNVTVYHVDEKKVYQFHLSEIDDLLSS
jgi:hypothetical protein